MKLSINLNMTLNYCTQFPQNSNQGKSSESVQLAMLKACDACADMGQW